MFKRVKIKALKPIDLSRDSAILDCSGADMCLNCSFSVKSTKFGTETVFKMTKKIGYGGKPEIAVLPS